MTTEVPVTSSSSMEPGSPDWYLSRLIRRIGNESQKDKTRLDYVSGNHPLPNGDRRYVKSLRELQRKALTNYVALAVDAVTQRMEVQGFKFSGVVDEDAWRIWKANSLDFQASVAIRDAATYGRSFMLVSPPENGVPVITIEDPRLCTLEADPLNPMKSRAGLKYYRDDIEGRIVGILYTPDRIYRYHGPHADIDVDNDAFLNRVQDIRTFPSMFELVDDFENPLGVVPLIRGIWRPADGLSECEVGFDIQDRMNHTMLDRLIIVKNQSYRQRLLSNTKIKANKAGQKTPPFDPGADMIWVMEDDAKLTDLNQAEIKDLLEAIRNDIDDFAAITQTPVTYLSHRLVNVSGSTLSAAQHSLISKVKKRMDTMGWYFEKVVKTGFRYLGDSRADDPVAETTWTDPEIRTTAEIADMVQKFRGAGVPMRLTLEYAGFRPEEVEKALEEFEAEQAKEQSRQEALRSAPPTNPAE